MDNLEVPKTSMNRPVFVISALLIVCFSIYGSAFNEHASASFLSVQKFLVGNFGWFYIGVVALFFCSFFTWRSVVMALFDLAPTIQNQIIPTLLGSQCSSVQA